MGQIPSSEVFDNRRFLDDVRAYKKRNNLTGYELADQLDMDRSLVLRLIRTTEYNLSFYSAVKLAVVCDLDLNKYIKARREWVKSEDRTGPLRTSSISTSSTTTLNDSELVTI